MTDEPIHSPIRPVADEHAHVPADYEVAPSPLDLPAILSRAEGATEEAQRWIDLGYVSPYPQFLESLSDTAPLCREVERLLGELDGANDVWAESSARWTSDMGAVVAKLQAAEADAASLRALVPVWRGGPEPIARLIDHDAWCVHDWPEDDNGESWEQRRASSMTKARDILALALPAVPGGCLEDQERLAAKDDATASPQAPVGVSEPSADAEEARELLGDLLALIAEREAIGGGPTFRARWEAACQRGNDFINPSPEWPS